MAVGIEPLLQFPQEMATHYSILAWKIPRAEEPGRLQSMGSQRWNRRTYYRAAMETDTEKRLWTQQGKERVG